MINCKFRKHIVNPIYDKECCINAVTTYNITDLEQIKIVPQHEV